MDADPAYSSARVKDVILEMTACLEIQRHDRCPIDALIDCVGRHRHIKWSGLALSSLRPWSGCTYCSAILVKEFKGCASRIPGAERQFRRDGLELRGGGCAPLLRKFALDLVCEFEVARDRTFLNGDFVLSDVLAVLNRSELEMPQLEAIGIQMNVIGDRGAGKQDSKDGNSESSSAHAADQ